MAETQDVREWLDGLDAPLRGRVEELAQVVREADPGWSSRSSGGG
ncbi:hypothetical protein [Nonomuraea recticatena]